MASHRRRVLQTTRIEFHVPAPEPWGANYVELEKAFTAAQDEMSSRGIDLRDDSISVAPRDDVLVVSYELRQSTEEENDRD